jgi:putative pyruvate formate lyase activating enzyme
MLDNLFGEDIGIVLDNGILTDEIGRTNISEIYAAGDVISGSCQLAHVAMEQGKRVARYIAGQALERQAIVANCIYIHPEIASVGLSEADAKERGFNLPFVWNSSGYELPETLQLLEGLIDIYLPDLKTLDQGLASKYLHAPDYPKVVKKALEQMVKSAGPMQMDRSEAALAESEDGLMKKGVCVRHLMTPGSLRDTIRVIDYLADTYGDRIWFSLMSQYTPMGTLPFEELNRKVDRKEYEQAVDHVIARGIENCMIQEGDVAVQSFIPAFDGEGVLPE